MGARKGNHWPRAGSWLFITFVFGVIFSVGATSCEDSPPAEDDMSEYGKLEEIEYEIGYGMTLFVPAGSKVHSAQSLYQKVELYATPHFGKVLVLDDCIQLTERDASSYNEMMAHVPMMEHPNPKRILVIGGGDGYVVNEVRDRFSTVEERDNFASY
jgi:hypothetical protein